MAVVYQMNDYQPDRQDAGKSAERRYDAESQGSRTQNWYTPDTDADGAINNPSIIRSRARDLARNNPWTRKAIDVIVNNTVGHGILAEWSGQSKKRLQALWQQWAESPECDASGYLDFYGLQSLVMRTIVESGECIIRRRVRRASDGLTIPMQLQVLEPDYLVKYLDGTSRSGNRVDSGIEYDAIGRRVAYYLYNTHPGARFGGLIGATSDYSRVPAVDIIHIFRKDRPDQERGVSWLAPVMITLRELDIYEDAYLNRQKLANLHAGFIHTEEDIDVEEEQYSAIDGGLKPGSLFLMRPNRSIEFNSPPPAGDYGPYTLQNLRRVAAGLGISFEAMTGDLSQVNFSSARMGWQEMGRNVDSWRWQMLIPSFCQRVAEWFADWSGSGRAVVEWTPPARMMVDPAREIPPIKEAIRSGLLSPQEAMRERGYDPRRLLAEWQEFAGMVDEMGLTLDIDPRKTNGSGALNQDKQEANDAEDSKNS